MRVLVTGANGFVGKVLCTELRLKGHAVRAAVRSVNKQVVGVNEILITSIDNDTNWSSALQNIELVIHLAARVHVMNEVAVDALAEFRKVNVEGTLNLANQAAKAGVKRFIFISSIGVNGNVTNTGYPFSEDSKSQPNDPYSISKHEAEQLLHKLAKKTGLEIVIIRPPLVYGYGAPGNFGKIISTLKTSIPLPLGAIQNKRSFVYVGNLVSLIVRCMDHPAAANQVFLVSDGCDLSTTELLQKCAVAMNVKARLLPVPQKFLEFCLVLLGKRAVAQRLCGNLQVDISKAHSLLGWVPPVSVEDGLKATALGLIEAK
jgi:nucleoside-diphosphate-sugar epimerase